MKLGLDRFLMWVGETGLDADASQSKALRALSCIPYLLVKGFLLTLCGLALLILAPLIFVTAILTAPSQRKEPWIRRRRNETA